MATDAFALTSHWQISQDLVEEWIACNSPPLSNETRFFDNEWQDRYVFPCLDVAPSEDFTTDFSFVNLVDLVEHKAEAIIGFYGDREHKGRCQSLAKKRRLNCVLNAMGLRYADQSGPLTSLPVDDNGQSAEGDHWTRGEECSDGVPQEKA